MKNTGRILRDIPWLLYKLELRMIKLSAHRKCSPKQIISFPVYHVLTSHFPMFIHELNFKVHCEYTKKKLIVGLQ